MLGLCTDLHHQVSVLDTAGAENGSDGLQF